MAVQSNELLRAARERTPSPSVPGECMSRAELAEAVNTWLWDRTGHRYELDGHHIAKYERGVVHYPIGPYRAALRAVLGVAHDAELGFVPPTRRQARATGLAGTGQRWVLEGILNASDNAVRWTLLNRRHALQSGLAATGSALLGPLATGWLEPLDGWGSRRGATFSEAEAEALERVVRLFCRWRSVGTGFSPVAVVGQLAEVTDRLRGAADDPRTHRVFLAAAELAKLTGSMYFDTGAHGSAQRYYVLALQLAKAAGEDSFGATTLAALARQSFDLGVTSDGLELVGLAQHGTRGAATPRLRTLLATRQAWGHALRGEVYAFHRAVANAQDSFTDAGPAREEPHWLAGLDAAELAGVIGARFRDLAHHQPKQAHHAVAYIARALQLRDPAQTRNRVFDLIGLARAHLITGQPEHGCALVSEAMPLIDQDHPGRMARKLGDWHREATRYTDVTAVRETQDRVRRLLANDPP